MIGEMDFGDMFHGDDEYDTSVYYETLTYALFILFLCLVTIVIMNLLVSENVCFFTHIIFTADDVQPRA